MTEYRMGDGGTMAAIIGAYSREGFGPESIWLWADGKRSGLPTTSI